MSDSETDCPPARAERRYRLLKGVMNTAERSDIPLVIRNISTTGLGASTSDRLPEVGSEVSVLLPNGQIVRGSVKWAKGKNFGVALVEPISLDAQIADRPSEPPASNWEVKRLHKVDTPRVDPGTLRRI